MRCRSYLFAILTILLALAAVACGNGNGGAGIATGTVNVHLSDPPTCSNAVNGAVSHVYVTIMRVDIHASATAPDNDPGWITLVNLSSSPRQVDLLGPAVSGCFLANLGSGALQPGNYQQIRLVLAPNNTTVANNQCGSAGANCVVLAAEPNNPKQLQIPSGVQTGLKIPPGQIAGGQFTIAAGQTKELNIDFDACASLVLQGNGLFRLKPTLFAGEVALTSNAISGRVVDDATGQPIPGGRAIVSLQRRSTTDTSANGVDLIMQAAADASGNFTLCPVPAGTYDVVVAAVGASDADSFAPTIVTGVQPGSALGNVRMFAISGASTAPANILGRVTTQNAGGASPADVSLAAVQTYSVSGVQASFIVPLVHPLSNALPSTTLTVATVADASCPGLACADYGLQVPAANAMLGTFNPAGTTFSPAGVGTPAYSVRARPALSCTPASLTIGPFSVSGGGTVNNANLAFTGCS